MRPCGDVALSLVSHSDSAARGCVMLSYLAGQGLNEEASSGIHRDPEGREVGKEAGKHSDPVWAEQDCPTQAFPSCTAEKALYPIWSHIRSPGSRVGIVAHRLEAFSSRWTESLAARTGGCPGSGPPTAAAPPHDRNPLLLPASLHGLLFTLPRPPYLGPHSRGRGHSVGKVRAPT